MLYSITGMDMKTYEKTHPWITFGAKLEDAQPSLWIMLGECLSKCEHIAGIPLRPDTAMEMYQVYLAKGVLATTAIEGNTLTEEQVLKQLKGQLKLPLSQEYLQQEIANIIQVCQSLQADIVAHKSFSLTPEKIKEFNAHVLAKLKLAPEVIPGIVRSHSVGVALYRAAPAEDCDYLLGRLCEWLNGPDFEPRKGLEIPYAIIKAIFAHLYLAWIHPFADGNGRTARLIEFAILIGSGVPAPSAQLLSNHYNHTRSEYYRQLDQTSRSGGNAIPFLLYAIQGFQDGLREQVLKIRNQQWDVAWTNYVHEQFGQRTGATHERRRCLVLDLTRQENPTPLSKISELSPRLTKAYANKTKKTITRDLNNVENMKLVSHTKDGYIARKGIILAFLPPRMKPPE